MTTAELAEKVRAITEHMHCDCYSPDDAEWAPVLCPRCRLEQALEGDTDE